MYRIWSDRELYALFGGENLPFSITFIVREPSGFRNTVVLQVTKVAIIRTINILPVLVPNCLAPRFW